MNDNVQSLYEIRDFWLSNDLDSFSYVLLLPHCNKAWNTKMLLAFEKKLLQLPDNKYIGKKGIVLSEEYIQESGFYDRMIITHQQVEAIMAMYLLYQFTDRIIIGSLEQPYGRKLGNLIRRNIVNENDLIGSVIFQLRQE